MNYFRVLKLESLFHMFSFVNKLRNLKFELFRYHLHTLECTFCSSLHFDKCNVFSLNTITIIFNSYTPKRFLVPLSSYLSPTAPDNHCQVQYLHAYLFQNVL